MKVPEDFPVLYDIQDRALAYRWFDEHELVDLTTCGPQCPAYVPAEDPDDPADAGADWLAPALCEAQLWPDDIPPTGQPCPVLAARKDRSL